MSTTLQYVLCNGGETYWKGNKCNDDMPEQLKIYKKVSRKEVIDSGSGEDGR